MRMFLIYFWIYYIASTLGSLIETFWILYKFKRLEKRTSVIYGYHVPIYGLAAVLLVLIVDATNLDSWFYLFFFGFVISSFIEYFASLLQEKIFKTMSWNYFDFKFNLHGRVNLLYSILFGILSYSLYELILDPLKSYFISVELTNVFVKGSLLLVAFVLIDYIISIVATFRWTKRQSNTAVENKYWEKFDKIYNNKRMHNTYPSMVYLK